MLIGALAVFTLVAVMGLSMVFSVWRGADSDPGYAALHGIVALIGSAMVIVTALEGDTRLYLNIGLAVVVIVLGAVMGIYAKKRRKAPKLILLAHVGLAIVCYGALAFFALNPHANLL